VPALRGKIAEEDAMNEDLTLAEYIVWFDYGTEGWKPYAFDTWDEVMSEVRGGLFGWIITRPVRIPEPPKED
jgi:hypothetical protein